MRQKKLILTLILAALSLEACTRKPRAIDPEGESAGVGQGAKAPDDLGAGTPGTPVTDASTANNGASSSAQGGSVSTETGTTTPDMTAVTPDSRGRINSERDIAKPSNGRAPYKPMPAGYNAAMVTQWVSAHQASNPGFKYVYVGPQIAVEKDKANLMRVALGKAWNHLSWLAAIDIPQEISDGTGLVFALNVQKLWGNRAEQNWNAIAACAPKPGVDVSPADRTGCDRFNAAQPAEITRFVFNAMNGGPYSTILDTPPDYGSFQNKFSLGPIIATSTHKEAIVCGPRITAYRYVNYNGTQLLYSFSSDEFRGRDGGEIKYTNAPTDNDERGTGAFSSNPGGGSVAIASEWWMQLPNGFMYWGIHGEGSQERGRAEIPFAIDPANWNQGWELQTGRSCVSCHVNGIQSAPSDGEFAGRNGWTSNDQLNQLYAQTRLKFQAAMTSLVKELSDSDDAYNQRIISGTLEPVAYAIREIEGPYPGGQSCEFFCNGKYGQSRQNLCEKLPLK